MIASLMMYGRGELADANDRFWDLIRANLEAAGVLAPGQLSQSVEEMAVWFDPDLVLSQTCGMPFRVMLHDKVQLVGTPNYGLEGCAAGQYRSAIVVRKDDPRGALAAFENAVFAYNQTMSQSGFAAPYFHAKSQGVWFKSQLATGGHVMSARAVAEGRADIAALDAVSWRLMQRYDGFADHLRVLEWTAPTPGLPLITSLQHDPDVMFEAVSGALKHLSSEDQDALGLRGLVRFSMDDYLSVPNPPEDAGVVQNRVGE